MFLLLGLASAEAGRRKPLPGDPTAHPPDVVAQEPASDPGGKPREWKEALFLPVVIADPGPVPAGLASLSSSTCAACHPVAHDGWAASAHARPPSQRLLDAAVGLSGCDACHRPLLPQREALDTVWDGQLDRATSAPNPAFDAGLLAEGVTCAACHVRGGLVLAADPEGAQRAAPHPTAWSAELASGDVCAACHQLTVPGPEVALYDTVGEWRRSGFAEAGVTCLSCHGRSGADPGTAGHDPARRLDHAVTVGLSVPSLALVRGAGPVAATLTLANTGAGHAVPTGTPWRGLQLRATLERRAPDGKDDAPIVILDAPLRREVAPTSPFATTADTRLQAGETRAWPLALALGADQRADGWALVVRLSDPDDPLGDAIVRRWPLRVE
jgi:hypothetical protein